MYHFYFQSVLLWKQMQNCMFLSTQRMVHWLLVQHSEIKINKKKYNKYNLLNYHKFTFSCVVLQIYSWVFYD